MNEAIVLQQIHYWLSLSRRKIQGKKWVYNTYEEWQKQFPFWSVKTIIRTIKSLEKKGLLISANWNKSIMDKTKWYTIEYEKVVKLMNKTADPSSRQFVHSNRTECPDGDDRLSKAIPEITSETSTEKMIYVAEVINYFNEKTHSEYKVTSRKTQELILERANEGFTLDDFKKVIDMKTDEWKHDPKMCLYLRPQTLFGNKFESYLNQKSFKRRTYREEDFDLED